MSRNADAASMGAPSITGPAVANDVYSVENEQ